ncbi:MAG: NUDIX domain-containing protein [Gemmatimonadota bacterium]
MPKPKRADREVSAGGVVFRRVAEGLRFLIIRDSYAKWGLPKGHLENGETPAAAALRETEEEVGLTGLVMHGPIRMVDWRFRAKGGRYIHKFCQLFF